VRTFFLLFTAVLVIGLPRIASADVVTFQALATGATSTSSRQYDLAPTRSSAWKISGVALTGKTITSLNLNFRSISNRDNNPNMLFTHLLDRPKLKGVSAFQDASGTPGIIHNDFAGTHHLNNLLINAPKPATVALLGTGLAGLYYRRRRQQNSRLVS
jgi:hypothetical protein